MRADQRFHKMDMFVRDDQRVVGVWLPLDFGQVWQVEAAPLFAAQRVPMYEGRAQCEVAVRDVAYFETLFVLVLLHCED